MSAEDLATGERSGLYIEESRLDELMDKAILVASRGPSACYATVFSSALGQLIRNEHRLRQRTEIVVEYEREAGPDTVGPVTYVDAFAQGISLLQRCDRCRLCAEHQASL